MRCSYCSRQCDAEAQQAEWQADGDLSGCGHRAFTTVCWTGGAQLLLLTNTITTNWRQEKRGLTNYLVMFPLMSSCLGGNNVKRTMCLLMVAEISVAHCRPTQTWWSQNPKHSHSWSHRKPKLANIWVRTCPLHLCPLNPAIPQQSAVWEGLTKWTPQSRPR